MFFDWPLRICAAKNGGLDAAGLRRSWGICAGWTGVFVNAFLAVLKFAVAVYTGSVAIAVDAVNNLSYFPCIDVYSHPVTLRNSPLHVFQHTLVQV